MAFILGDFQRILQSRVYLQGHSLDIIWALSRTKRDLKEISNNGKYIKNRKNDVMHH